MFTERGLLVISFVLLIVVGVYIYERESQSCTCDPVIEYWHINF